MKIRKRVVNILDLIHIQAKNMIDSWNFGSLEVIVLNSVYFPHIVILAIVEFFSIGYRPSTLLECFVWTFILSPKSQTTEKISAESFSKKIY
jgi:hypothetical protein